MIIRLVLLMLMWSAKPSISLVELCAIVLHLGEEQVATIIITAWYYCMIMKVTNDSQFTILQVGFGWTM